MLNRCEFIGRVGQDPDCRTMGNGGEVANISLAVSEKWKDRATGERKEKTEWVRIVCFNEHLIKVIKNYVKKGSLLFVSGQIQTRKWTDQQGNDKYSTEIVLAKFKGELTMLDSRQDNQSNDCHQNQDGMGGQQNNYDSGVGDLSDETPF